MHRYTQPGRTILAADQQRSFFDVPQFKSAPPPRLAPRAADGNTLLAGFLRRRLIDELRTFKEVGATIDELHERIRYLPRVLAARLEELLQDGDVVREGDRWWLKGWKDGDDE